jgi:hypothetical protein
LNLRPKPTAVGNIDMLRTRVGDELGIDLPDGSR